MTKNKFFTKKGWLTPYALACGYIHKSELPSGTTVRLERIVDFYRVEAWLPGYGWKPFYSLDTRNVSEARNSYRTQVGRLQRRFETAPDVSRNVIV